MGGKRKGVRSLVAMQGRKGRKGELIRDGGSGITTPLGPEWKATRRPNIESGAAEADHQSSDFGAPKGIL